MEKRIHDFLPQVKDYYTITDEGLFYSDNSGLMKTPNKGNTDYQIINFMTVDGKKKTYRVHRLVLMAFNPIDNMGILEVNHIDGNKKNNKLSNLEWVTTSENQKHAYKMGLQKAKRGQASNFSKLTEENIKEIFEFSRQGMLQREIADYVGCSRSNISYILNHKTWNK